MNAKARKREKRQASRQQQHTSAAPEDEALDATLLIAKESATPPLEEKKPSTDDETDKAAQFRMKMLPRTFACVLTTRLEAAGHGTTTEVELETLARIMEQRILPSMEENILQMRRMQAEGDTIKQIDIWLNCEVHADRAPADEAPREGDMGTQEASQQGNAGAVQGSSEDSVTAQQDTAEGAQDEPQSLLWEAALATAKSEGGPAEQVKARAIKILRKRKQRKKAKDKKLIVTTDTVAVA